MFDNKGEARRQHRAGPAVGMTELRPIGADSAPAPVAGKSSARTLFWRLMWLYQGGCAAAITGP